MRWQLRNRRNSIAKNVILQGAAIMLVVSCESAGAGEVEIVAAKAHESGTTHTIDVTLRHGDTGWEHYADKWEVLAPTGEILGERVLFHPHENEQPFTRSLSGVAIPKDAGFVHIRAHDKVHGHSSQLFKVKL